MAVGRDSPSVFQRRILPEGARLAGWAWLTHALGLQAPVRGPQCISSKHVRGGRRSEGPWTVLDKRYWPGETISDHLSFALRRESLDLLVLKRVFEAVGPKEIEAFVRATPTGATSRRAWLLFEKLTRRDLDLPDAAAISAVNVLDPRRYIAGEPRLSRRHRVNDNLLGVASFCPIVRRTEALERLMEQDLANEVRRIAKDGDARLVARATSFLLLADSRASFNIEGENPPRDRLERWGEAVLETGRAPLTLDEILRLQGVLAENDRFLRPGLRERGVFLGERARDGAPVPEFVGARPQDLGGLIDGLLDANRRMQEAGIDPVLQAAATAFGFVYVHPFQDGNGRIHRCLIHHVLAERGFTPGGLVLPVSSAMLDRIEEYRAALRAHTSPLMPSIDWRPTLDLNVEVMNDTADLYRYFDCTGVAEFLYSCVAQAVREDLPREIDYLRRRDDALRAIRETVAMPERMADDFLAFVRRNKGALPARRRRKEFRELSDREVATMESIVKDAFDGFDDAPAVS